MKKIVLLAAALMASSSVYAMQYANSVGATVERLRAEAAQKEIANQVKNEKVVVPVSSDTPVAMEIDVKPASEEVIVLLEEASVAAPVAMEIGKSASDLSHGPDRHGRVHAAIARMEAMSAPYAQAFALHAAECKEVLVKNATECRESLAENMVALKAFMARNPRATMVVGTAVVGGTVVALTAPVSIPVATFFAFNAAAATAGVATPRETMDNVIREIKSRYEEAKTTIKNISGNK